MIHATAVVDPSAVLGEGVEIGAYAVVGARAVLGAGTRLAAHACVRPDTVLGRQVFVDSHAVIGGDPQVRGFDPAVASRVEVGDRTIFREHVTIHRGSKPGSVTRIGADGFFMAASHVAHDCVVEDFVTFANSGAIAGHVFVGAHAFVSGNTGVHQFCRIGTGAIVSAVSYMSVDVPPFCTAAERNAVVGLNRVGMRRRGIPAASIQDVKDCYRAVFLSGKGVKPAAVEALAAGCPGKTPEGRLFLEFCAQGTRGFVRPRERGAAAQDAE